MDVESAEELDNFISERLPMTSQRIDTYGLSKTYYTIGSLHNATGQEKLTYSISLQQKSYRNGCTEAL